MLAWERFGKPGDVKRETAGELLIRELGCRNCHGGGLQNAPKPAPTLRGVGNRLRADWMRAFLLRPLEVAPGTTMPDLLHGFTQETKEQTVDALVAYLSTRVEAFPEIASPGLNPAQHAFWLHGDRETGRRLFHSVGCVACHEPDADRDPTRPRSASILDQLAEQLDPAEAERVGLGRAARASPSAPMGDLPAKYSFESLTRFLMDPGFSRPAERMPDLKLAPLEAASIANYLIGSPHDDDLAIPRTLPESPEPKQIEKGREYFLELGCERCHRDGDRTEPSPGHPIAKDLRDLDPALEATCWKNPTSAMPLYGLSAEQIGHVEAALQQARNATSSRGAQAELQMRLLQFGCHSCHRRSGRGGPDRQRSEWFETVGHVDLGDEGRLPPHLDGVGRKLRPSHALRVLTANVETRPHLRARMPRYSHRAMSALPKLFADADRADAPNPLQTLDATDELALAGRQLLDIGCVQCHPVRQESLPGVVGVDLAGTTARVRPAWFREFLLDPDAWRRGTRMPSFFPGGKSQSPDILGGDTERQVAAIWAYLRELELRGVEASRLPAKIESARARAYELIPRERPILLRTFMELAGTHALAAGFPDGVHWAFDTSSVRLAEAWRGRFLDAYGTWFVRFTPPAKPLGTDRVELPRGVPFQRLADIKEPWPDEAAVQPVFGGYRLDGGGVPTLLYSIDGMSFEDRIVAVDQSLERRIVITNASTDRPKTGERPAQTIWFRALAGEDLTLEDPQSCRRTDGLRVRWQRSPETRSELRAVQTGSEWRIECYVENRTTLELRYTW